MRVRDKTFYTFFYDEGYIDSQQRYRAEQMADALGDDFIGSHFEKKWFIEYYFTANNQAFLEHIAEFDTPEKIRDLLHEQLYYYVERTPVEPPVSMFEDPVILTLQWLENTRFIAKKAYKETDNEVYKLVVKWCKWKKQQIDTHHGLDRISKTAPSTVTDNSQSAPTDIVQNEPTNVVPQPVPPKGEQQELTARERVLIHCYEERKPIKRGEPDYNDYITFAIPAKRLAYPGDSPSKAKSLLNSIRKILPYLSEKAAQQANNEIHTIESKKL